jgi:hypothetical protein
VYGRGTYVQSMNAPAATKMEALGCILSGSKLYFIVLLYFQKYKTWNVNPETMYFCFRVLYFQKYKKTITFSITFSMLGAPGVYFLS